MTFDPEILSRRG